MPTFFSVFFFTLPQDLRHLSAHLAFTLYNKPLYCWFTNGLRLKLLFIYFFFSTSKVVKGATNTIFIKIVKHWEIRYHRKYSSLSCIWISSYNLHHNRRSNIWKTHKHHHRKVSTRRFLSNNSNFRFHPTTRTSFDGLWADKTSWVSSKGATSNICVIGNSQ